MKKIWIFSLALFLVANSNAFTLNSSTNPTLTGWADSEVKLLLNATNCPTNVDVEGLISSAAEVWNNVPTSNIKVTYGGTTTSTSYASPPTVYCEPNFQNATNGADPNSVPGAASVGTSSGRISQGVLYLNVSGGLANIANYDQTKLKIIVAHEIGHLLGLGHSESSNALMYYDATARTNLSLSQDDIDGISYLYPSDEFQNNKIAGCGSIHSQISPPPGSTKLILILFILPLVYAWFLRRRLRTLRMLNY